MSSSIKLTNSSGKIVTITNPDTTSADVAVDLLNNAYTIATVDDFGTVPVGYTTVIVKDTDRGGVFNRIASTTANGGTIFDGTTGYSWERQYSGAVNVKWFGAKGDFNTSTEYGTNDTNAIQNAIDYAASNSKNVFISKGNYKITSSLVISSGVHIEGEGVWASVLVNRCTNEPTIFIGGSETVWSGYQTTVYNIQFLGDGGDGSQNHGVYVRATLVAIDNCRFYKHSGSGIFGKFAQYNKYTNNGFANNSRYGIEIYTDDYNSYLSGDLEISGNYENISNTLGGMYLEVSNSKIVKNTHTDLPTCLEVFGYGNTIDSNTFEATGTTTSTMLKITNYILSNTVTKNTFMGSSTNITPMNVVSGKCVVKNNIFNCSPTGTIAYITNTADNFNVSIEDNKFTDKTRKAITYAGLDKTIYSNRVDSIKSRTGAGPFFVTEPSVIKLPLKGIWELSVTTGGNNYDYINNRASRVFIVFYLNNQYTFDHVTGQKLTGNATNLDITSVDINGNVGIIAGNNINAPISFFVTARMIGASESYS